jgi:hypothetical protein
MKKNLKEFIDDLSWLNMEKSEPVISLYVMRKLDTIKPTLNISDSSRVKKISYANLYDDEQKQSVCIDVFDINIDTGFNTMDSIKDLVEHLLIDVLKQNAFVSWCMFEGGLVDINNLFSEWESESTYAICLPKNKPVFALSKKDRKSKEWKD